GFHEVSRRFAINCSSFRGIAATGFFWPRFEGNQAAFGGIVAYNSGLAGFLAGITGQSCARRVKNGGSR
ncbi:hypothetical protein ABTE05_20670, partial [Acinetobacter baumannii]